MHTSAPKQIQPQKTDAAGFAQSEQSASESFPSEHALLQLQRAVGNRMVQRMLKSEAGEAGAESSRTKNELAHTVQQDGVADRLQRQPAPTPPPKTAAIPTLSLTNDTYTDDKFESNKNINFNVTVPAGLNKRDYALVQLMKGSAKETTDSWWGLGGPTYFTRVMYGQNVPFNFPSWQVDSNDRDPVYGSENNARWNYPETSSGFSSSDQPGPASSRKPGSVYALNFKMGLYKLADLPATTTGTISASPLAEVPWQYSVQVGSSGAFTHPNLPP